MERRVALLRAINVGGTGTLRMARLRDIVARLGWHDVSTLGASGNLLYAGGGRNADADAALLSRALEGELGKPVAVVVRSRRDMERVRGSNPFAGADARIPSRWWFAGFLAAPSNRPLPDIPVGAPLAYAARLPDVVCWTMSSPHLRAIDQPRRIEKALGVAMTVRNWNVVTKIADRLAAPLAQPA